MGIGIKKSLVTWSYWQVKRKYCLLSKIFSSFSLSLPYKLLSSTRWLWCSLLNFCWYYRFCSFQALFLGGQDKLPAFLARITIPGLDIVVDPCAAILICIVTVLLCIGIKKVFLVDPWNFLLSHLVFHLWVPLLRSTMVIFQSSLAQTIVTTINVCALLFIAIVGGYLGFRDGWVGYDLPNG